MNYVEPISRAFLCQYRNGDDFLTNPTTDFVPYMQGNVLDKLKLNASYNVSTITEASTDVQIKASSTGVTDIVRLKLPISSWKNEGFVLGNAVRVEANGTFTTGTVTSIFGTLMQIDSANFFTTLSVTDGEDRDDYVIKVTTVPTSLIFKFGLISNAIEANSYTSMLDGQAQVYSKNGIDGTPAVLNYISTESSDLGSVTAAYNGASGTGNYIFRFDINHVFRVPHFLEAWVSEYLESTIPSLYSGVNSIRYTSELNFGVNIANPNDGKIFLDDFELGSIGFNGENFNTGLSNYALISTVLTVAGVVTTTPQATLTNSYVCQIQKLDGNFTAAVEGILYHSRLASAAIYSDNANTFDTNFMLDQLRQEDGVADVSSTIIKDLSIDINGGDASLLDITFDVIYDAAEQDQLTTDEIIYLGLEIGDVALDADVSDRMTVNLFAERIFKNPDITGLVDTFEDAYNNLGSTVTSSNIDTWVNRAIENEFSFSINKDTGDGDVLLESLRFDLVAYNVTTGEFFSLDTFTFPIGVLPVVAIDGVIYQLLDLDTTRVLDVPVDISLREVQLNMTNPQTGGNEQEVTGKLGFIIPWREWILNPFVSYDFYNGALPPNFNRNYRTSNYSNLLGYDIYVFKTAAIKTISITEGTLTTDYILQSDDSNVSDFDVDGAGDSWTHVSTIIYNPSGEVIEDIDLSGFNTIEIIMAQAAAGSISMANTYAEITFENSLTSGREWRLHSTLDFTTFTNPLEPLVGESFVKVTQMIPENQIKLECRVDGLKLENNNKNIHGHFFQ